jgi:hypothetical protein
MLLDRPPQGRTPQSALRDKEGSIRRSFVADDRLDSFQPVLQPDLLLQHRVEVAVPQCELAVLGLLRNEVRAP